MTRTLRGFAFPFRIAPPERGTSANVSMKGGVVASEGFEKIEQNVRHLLSTRLGERTMLRTYGGGVHQRLQEPNDGVLRALLQHEIEEAFRSYAPGVTLAAPIAVRSEHAELKVTVQYFAEPSRALQRTELVVL